MKADVLVCDKNSTSLSITPSSCAFTTEIEDIK